MGLSANQHLCLHNRYSRSTAEPTHTTSASVIKRPVAGSLLYRGDAWRIYLWNDSHYPGLEPAALGFAN